MTNNIAIVMGPVGSGDNPESQMLSPAQIDALEDRMLWREAISDWILT